MNHLFRPEQHEAEPPIRFNRVGRRIDGEMARLTTSSEAKLRRQVEQLSRNTLALMCPMNEKHGDMPALPQMQHADDLLVLPGNQGDMVASIALAQGLGCGISVELVTPLRRIERSDEFIEDLAGQPRNGIQLMVARYSNFRVAHRGAFRNTPGKARRADDVQRAPDVLSRRHVQQRG